MSESLTEFSICEEGAGYMYLVLDSESKESCELAGKMATKSACRDDEQLLANLFARLAIFQIFKREEENEREIVYYTAKRLGRNDDGLTLPSTLPSEDLKKCLATCRSAINQRRSSLPIASLVLNLIPPA